jgi:hypothetical protein
MLVGIIVDTSCPEFELCHGNAWHASPVEHHGKWRSNCHQIRDAASLTVSVDQPTGIEKTKHVFDLP